MKSNIVLFFNIQKAFNFKSHYFEFIQHTHAAALTELEKLRERLTLSVNMKKFGWCLFMDLFFHLVKNRTHRSRRTCECYYSFSVFPVFQSLMNPLKTTQINQCYWIVAKTKITWKPPKQSTKKDQKQQKMDSKKMMKKKRKRNKFERIDWIGRKFSYFDTNDDKISFVFSSCFACWDQ